MTEETSRLVLTAVIASFPPTIAAVAALVVALRSKSKLTDLHLQINSRMDQLLALSAKVARAEGVESQRTRPESE